MTHWRIDNSWAYLLEVFPADEVELYDKLKVRPKKYYFDYKFRTGQWDGWNYYYDMNRKRVMAGLLDMIDEMGFKWERKYIQAPISVTNEITELEGITYAVKQLEAVTLVKQGRNRGIFDYVTGMGKTAMIAGITKMLDRKTLIIVPGIDLLNQNHSEIKRFTGIDCGKIGGGFNQTDRKVCIITDDSLKKLPKWRYVVLAKDLEVILMDEVHNCTERLNNFLQACENAYFRYGLSGTPFDLGNDRSLNIMGLFGPVLCSADAQDLVDAKRGVPAHFIFVDSLLPKTNACDYVDLYDSCIVKNLVYHSQVTDVIKKHNDGNTSILVLVRRTAHGISLLNLLRAQGVTCEFTCGKHRANIRETLKDKFKKTELRVLIASDIYKEGVDLPCIDVLVLAGAGDSDKDWSQRVGRSLRANPGKDKALVYDFNFMGNKIFERHSKKRLQKSLKLPRAKVFKLESLFDEPILLSKEGL